MKFSEFKRISSGILDRVGPEKFGKVGVRLHDVEASSQWAQVMSPASAVARSGDAIDIRPGRAGITLAQVVARAQDAADKIGGDPEIRAAGDPVFVFGYDSQAGSAVASYDIPPADDADESEALDETDGIEESVLDAPMPGMDPSIWREGADGPELTDVARRVVEKIAAWAVAGRWVPPDANVRVVGSIASNSYSDESDVDLHFSGGGVDFGGKSKMDFNKDFKHAFEKFVEANPRLASIGGRPVEVFAQKNVFQDLTSAGCYNVKTREWEVGPDVKDLDYDPYSDYYEDGMKLMEGLIKDLRSAIMSVYEKASVYRRSSDPDFREKIGGELMRDAGRAADLFRRVKDLRGAEQGPGPRSREEALEIRSRRDWHVSDSAFKLLGKLGYIGICKACRDAVKNELSPEQTADAVAAAMAEGVGKNAGMVQEGDSVGGIPAMDRASAEADIKAFAEEAFAENCADADVVEVWLHGSRMRGNWCDDSDLDAVVFYMGTEREDDAFSMLNSADPACDVCGVPVDFNPVRVEGQDDIDAYKRSSAEYDAEVLGEGVGSALRAAALAGMTLAAGGAFGGKAHGAPAGAPAAVQSAREPSYAGLSRSNMTNLLATIAYNESMLDWMKDRDDDKIIAVLNVVDNRAGGDPAKYASVISRKSQFFSAKHVKGGYVDKDYVVYDPGDEAKKGGGRLSPRQRDCWRMCNVYASDMLDKTLPNRIGDRNMIANKAKDSKASWEAWGKDCDLVIGSHAFGYDSRYDPKAGKKTGAGKETAYVVKSGDTLSGIARAHGTTAKALADKNGLSDPNKIRPGQKLRI